MRQLALSSRLMYTRPLPVSRMMSSLADRAQLNTMQYGKRPYGVGFLVIGTDDTGPHLYEFNPTGNCFEYIAMSIGARNQSAKTYLERHADEFASADLDELILHGLRALRETLPQNKEVRRIVSPSSSTPLCPSRTSGPARTPTPPRALPAAPTSLPCSRTTPSSRTGHGTCTLLI